MRPDADRPLVGGRLFFGPVGTKLEDMYEVTGLVGTDELNLDVCPVGELRIMSPYAVVGRDVRVPSHPDTPRKVWKVWSVGKRPGMVWLADGKRGLEVAVTDLDIVVASPHLCREDELCCDTCNVHLGCRCPEVAT